MTLSDAAASRSSRAGVPDASRAMAASFLREAGFQALAMQQAAAFNASLFAASSGEPAPAAPHGHAAARPPAPYPPASQGYWPPVSDAAMVGAYPPHGTGGYPPQTAPAGGQQPQGYGRGSSGAPQYGSGYGGAPQYGRGSSGAPQYGRGYGGASHAALWSGTPSSSSAAAVAHAPVAFDGRADAELRFRRMMGQVPAGTPPELVWELVAAGVDFDAPPAGEAGAAAGLANGAQQGVPARWGSAQASTPQSQASMPDITSSHRQGHAAYARGPPQGYSAEARWPDPEDEEDGRGADGAAAGWGHAGEYEKADGGHGRRAAGAAAAAAVPPQWGTPVAYAGRDGLRRADALSGADSGVEAEATKPPARPKTPMASLPVRPAGSMGTLASGATWDRPGSAAPAPATRTLAIGAAAHRGRGAGATSWPAQPIGPFGVMAAPHSAAQAAGLGREDSLM